MAQDPTMLKMFGRPVFSGTGRTSDVFPEPPDLSYLGPRPEFIPDEHDYNPALDPHNLVKAGLPIDLAMHLQEVRAGLHQGAQQERIRKDAQGALNELKDVDYASPKLSNQLLRIFSKYPNARKSKDVTDQVNFFTKLKPQEESIDVEQIADPILHNRAVKEGWGKLPKAEAQRKIGAYEHNQKILSHAMENGLSEEDLADTMDPEAGVYNPQKVAQKIKLGKYDPSLETDPRIAYQAHNENWGQLTKPEALQKKAISQLNNSIEDDAESMGVPAEELAPFKDPNTGLYDIGKVKGHLRQYQSKLKPTSGDIAKYTSKAKEERDALLSPEGKLTRLQARDGDPNKTQFSKEDWDWAHNEAMKEQTPSEAALAALQAPIVVGGKREPTSQAPESVAPTQAQKGGHPSISTQAEYDALPPGSPFVWSKTGQFGTKKGGVVARADGGPVVPGQTVLVGEKGPEIMVPHPPLPEKKKGLPPPTSGLRNFYKQNPYTPTAAQREASKLILNPNLPLPIRMPTDPIVVGKDGPELIVPQVHATIIPHPAR